MKIAGRDIGAHQPPYLIAEIGANHCGDLARALRTMEAAKTAGADAVKFQCYEADTITLDHDGPSFIIPDGPWKGQRLHDLYRRAQTPFAWFPVIAGHAKKVGITWFASVFDRTSVDLMERLDVAAIKIASFELVDTPLIRYAARLGKPMILSTGMASDREIMAARDAAILTMMKCDATAGEASDNVALLHCISCYPTPAGEANLGRLKKYPDGGARLWEIKAGCYRIADIVGLSDHTTGVEIPIAATALGAAIIEKHFTLSRLTHGGHASEDATFSLEPKEFAAMAAAVRNAWAACQPSGSPSQDPHRALRRSLYAVADIGAGEVLTAANIRSIRPGAGLPPADIDKVIGRTAARDILRGAPLAWEMIR